MGDLILFRPEDGTRRAAAPSGGAEILFFTGVRYQRASDEAEPAHASDLPRAGGKGGLGRNRRRKRAEPRS